MTTPLADKYPFTDEEINDAAEEVNDFANALGQFLAGYSRASALSPWAGIMALETIMADLLVSLSPRHRELFFRTLDIRKRVEERSKNPAIYVINLPSDKH